MKVGVLAGPGRVALADRPEPVAGPGELVVELAACGVCGTDLEKVRGHYATAGILGHEPVGVVRSADPAADGFRPGTRVFVHHHIPCYACEVCRRGDLTYCPEYGRSNLDPGGFAERFRVSAAHVRRGAVLALSDRVDWDEGALIEPAACALTALRAVGMPARASVFVLGLGPVGLLYARVARALGASWVGGADPAPLRRAAAERGGADVALDARDADAVRAAVRQSTDGGGVDLAVAATGAPSAIALAAALPRRGGTLNLFGVPEAGSRLEADLQELYLRGVRVLPTYATTERDTAEIHGWLAEGRLRLRDLVTHRIPLDRVEDAFRLAARPEEAVKVVVTGPAGG
jgi:L-iditol 2-dehydrogenase